MNPWRPFKIIVQAIENQKFSLLFGFLGLFSIIFIRNVFESSFEGSQILGFSPITARSLYMMFSHFPLFYISLFLWFLLVLVILSREDVNKVSKVLLYGMWAIIIVPLIDIVVSRGSGYKLTYLRGVEQLGEVYRFFDLSRDIIESSWGQRIEIVLALLGGFAYVLLKTKSIWRSAAAAATFYVVVFMHGALPYTVAKIPSYLGYSETKALSLITGGILPIDSQNYSLVFLLSCFVAGALLLRHHNPASMREVFSFRHTMIPIVTCLIGTAYGLLLLVRYYPSILLNPMTHISVAIAIITVHLVLIAVNRNLQDNVLLVLLVFCIFAAVALGPVFLTGTVILFFLVRWKRIPVVAVILTALLGFATVFQNHTLVSLVSMNQRLTEEYCRKVYAWNLFLDRRYPRALEEYQKAYALNQNQETNKRIGQCHLNLGNMAKGIKILEEIKPLDYETLASLSDAYKMIGQGDRALAVCDLAVATGIEPADFLVRSARLNARTGQERHAREALASAMKYGTAPYVFSEVMGDLYMAKNDLNAAQAEYRKALKKNNRSVAAHSGLATVFYYRGDYKTAEKEFLEALKYDPSDDALYNNLGAIYIMTGDLQKAASVFEKSIRINASQAEAYYNLGLIDEKTGNVNRAIEMYRNALSVNPGFVPALQALERLGLSND